MHLSFRGVHYEAKPSVMECSEGQVGGKYRGTPWKTHCPTKAVSHKSHHRLTYRGVSYLH